ncbi:hypothetical protein GOP47_0000203 [Adiantum capillus-veneris]|uniref:Uncharacterized protein n=1 Tax=Adiantum capillus-veneris TaxID=13818 RepID=A0A9D4VDH2_ADICA|nr:hypothetical protein GOP47_0000203 [Adiantum capillus-veneris]
MLIPEVAKSWVKGIYDVKNEEDDVDASTDESARKVKDVLDDFFGDLKIRGRTCVGKGCNNPHPFGEAPNIFGSEVGNIVDAFGVKATNGEGIENAEVDIAERVEFKRAEGIEDAKKGEEAEDNNGEGVVEAKEGCGATNANVMYPIFFN